MKQNGDDDYKEKRKKKKVESSFLVQNLSIKTTVNSTPWSAMSQRHELSAKSASFSSGFTPMTLNPSEKSKISCSSCKEVQKKAKQKQWEHDPSQM